MLVTGNLQKDAKKIFEGHHDNPKDSPDIDQLQD